MRQKSYFLVLWQTKLVQKGISNYHCFQFLSFLSAIKKNVHFNESKETNILKVINFNLNIYNNLKCTAKPLIFYKENFINNFLHTHKTF